MKAEGLGFVRSAFTTCLSAQDSAQAHPWLKVGLALTTIAPWPGALDTPDMTWDRHLGLPWSSQVFAQAFVIPWYLQGLRPRPRFNVYSAFDRVPRFHCSLTVPRLMWCASGRNSITPGLSIVVNTNSVGNDYPHRVHTQNISEPYKVPNSLERSSIPECGRLWGGKESSPELI